MEDISFIGSSSFYWKPFILVEIISFSGIHFRQWEPFLLGKTFVFLGNHCQWLKPFCLVEAIPFQRKLLLLIESFPFSGSHSFQCFNIFVSGSYLQLRELLNCVLDCVSVRLLKMANLSCIHFPIELFQSSEAYLEPCQTSGMKHFCEHC